MKRKAKKITRSMFVRAAKKSNEIQKEKYGEEGYIKSMAERGRLGGLANRNNKEKIIGKITT